ncbi:MAG: penicillin-binding protein 2 [Deltaproteobacteria bacterium]|nr:penicillin-binding protein 2 [Deltaproteobacteria bacterium]
MSTRYRWLVLAVAAVFLVLIGRLWQLQVLRAEQYRTATYGNMVQKRPLPTLRGRLLDRQGRVLADNQPAYSLVMRVVREKPDVLAELFETIGVSARQRRAAAARLARAVRRRRGDPFVLIRELSRDQLGRFEMHRERLKAFRVASGVRRHYPNGRLAAHVLGYMSLVSPAELADSRGQPYLPDDLVGRFGAERLFEPYLRGVRGIERVVVDAHGSRVDEPWVDQMLGQRRRHAPVPGDDVRLTLDLDLQRVVDDELSRVEAGAAAVVDVESGRILAMSSAPAFDPNLISGVLPPQEAKALLEDPRRPLLDKAVREHYFPGSVFKVATAIAALEAGVVDAKETIQCTGALKRGRSRFRCTHQHGRVDLQRALAESCNIYFYRIAERLGIDRLAKYARMLGFGSPTGLGLNGEVAGVVPDQTWYRGRSRRYQPGFALNAAIGQGDVKVTALQVATAYAAIANGTLMLPRLVERIEQGSGELVVYQSHPRARQQLPVAPQTLELLRRALTAAVHDRKGTAYAVRLKRWKVAGKTGTAQVGRLRGQSAQQEHAWFAAFAPAEQPQIAVAVLVEHGGAGAKAAAPIAMKIIERYLDSSPAHPQLAHTAEHRQR